MDPCVEPPGGLAPSPGTEHATCPLLALAEAEERRMLAGAARAVAALRAVGAGGREAHGSGAERARGACIAGRAGLAQTPRAEVCDALGGIAGAPLLDAVVIEGARAARAVGAGSARDAA